MCQALLSPSESVKKRHTLFNSSCQIGSQAGNSAAPRRLEDRCAGDVETGRGDRKGNGTRRSAWGGRSARIQGRGSTSGHPVNREWFQAEMWVHYGWTEWCGPRGLSMKTGRWVSVLPGCKVYREEELAMSLNRRGDQIIRDRGYYSREWRF